MKKLVFILFSILITQRAFSASHEINEFSGVFYVNSCTPDCSIIASNKSDYLYSFEFQNLYAFAISVVDETRGLNKTCDGSPRIYEFNIWAYNKNQVGRFMANNLLDDDWNPWRNICDGRFDIEKQRVSLDSSKAKIELRKLSTNTFELNWIDSRWGVSGQFQLTRQD